MTGKWNFRERSGVNVDVQNTNLRLLMLMENMHAQHENDAEMRHNYLLLSFLGDDIFTRQAALRKAYLGE